MSTQNVHDLMLELGRIAAHPIGKRVDITQGIVQDFDYPSLAENAVHNAVDTWQIRLQTYETLLPAQDAAGLLEWFYSFATHTVREYIGQDMLDLEDFTLRLGQVALDVYCRDGICWNIIAEFLEKMSQLAEGGLVGMWEGHVVNLVTGLTIWVKLSIRAPRRPI